MSGYKVAAVKLGKDLDNVAKELEETLNGFNAQDLEVYDVRYIENKGFIVVAAEPELAEETEDSPFMHPMGSTPSQVLHVSSENLEEVMGRLMSGLRPRSPQGAEETAKEEMVAPVFPGPLSGPFMAWVHQRKSMLSEPDKGYAEAAYEVYRRTFRSFPGIALATLRDQLRAYCTYHDGECPQCKDADSVEKVALVETLRALERITAESLQ